MAAAEQTPEYGQAQAYQVTDSKRCQFVLLDGVLAVKEVARYFKDRKITEGLGSNQFELHQRETADGKLALVVRVPEKGDDMSLKEFMKFLEEKGVKLLKAVVKEIKKLLEKESTQETAEQTEEEAAKLFGKLAK